MKSVNAVVFLFEGKFVTVGNIIAGLNVYFCSCRLVMYVQRRARRMIRLVLVEKARRAENGGSLCSVFGFISLPHNGRYFQRQDV